MKMKWNNNFTDLAKKTKLKMLKNEITTDIPKLFIGNTNKTSGFYRNSVK